MYESLNPTEAPNPTEALDPTEALIPTEAPCSYFPPLIMPQKARNLRPPKAVPLSVPQA